MPEVPAQSHGDLTRQLRPTLRRGETAESDLLLQTLRDQYPVPTADIVLKEVWGWNTDKLMLFKNACESRCNRGSQEYRVRGGN
jgi:hypothetical protein